MKKTTKKTIAPKTPQTINPVRERIISIRGAREHNLKNISLDIPRNKLIVITGVSGSGKSSLAFDTIYAEGQRRFVESLSAYARQFLERMNKPDVDIITGIPPAIAIQQKTTSRNPRSTVGTQTEIYDYLRLLFGRIGETRCYNCHNPVHKDTPQSVLHHITTHYKEGNRLYVLFPLRQHEHHSLAEELENIKGQGFFRIVIAGDDGVINAQIVDLNEQPITAKTDKNSIYVVVDRVILRQEQESLTRLADSLELTFRESPTCFIVNLNNGEQKAFSALYECATCKIPYDEPDPRLFSFNNPFGACSTCQGFGRSMGIDADLVIPDNRKSLADGAIQPFQTNSQQPYQKALLIAANLRGIRTNIPVQQFSKEEWDFVWNGDKNYPGIHGFFTMVEEQGEYKMHYRVLMSRYRGYTRCQECGGSRLKMSARQVFVGGRSLPEIVALTLEESSRFFASLHLNDYQQTIAERILKEIGTRLSLLNEIGLGYLTLDRLSHTLSGGESQRINLATSIGSTLVGALYVLDEPSIGLHPRDTDRMIRIMEKLRNLGNTVIVVEHDADIMRRADMIIDMGPRAGEHGGQVVARGNLQEIQQVPESLTGAYISGKLSIPIPITRNKGNGKKLIIQGASEHNLKDIDVEIPLGTMCVLTGVSGSGKSTLVYDVLYNNLLRAKGEAVSNVGKCQGIKGTESIGSVELVDQSPIGKTPRSTPATYTKAFEYIRDVFATTQAAKQLGWKAGSFSFNVPGGRCEVCEGDGVIKIEMQFLADLYLECEECKGSRYKREAHTILYRGKSIVDVIQMTVDEALLFFQQEHRITARLQALQDVGLGYMKLGQPGTTLSGGEAQRIKLAAHLLEKNQDSTLFIFDEPTTGLHLDDIAKLLRCFTQLVRRGHSLLIVEHNTEIIKSADWIIDLGPEAGEKGGYVIATGTPEKIITVEQSHTGNYLRAVLSQYNQHLHK